MSVTLDCVVERNPEIIFTDLDDTIVMMDADKGTYYELDPVGSRIWSLLENAASVTQLCDGLVEEYDVTPGVCRRDVLAFLEQAGALEVIAVRAPAES